MNKIKNDYRILCLNYRINYNAFHGVVIYNNVR